MEATPTPPGAPLLEVTPRPGTPLLEVSALTKAFGGILALREVTFEVAAGEVVALIGPNGAGKTTCFNLIHGELTPDAGDVAVAGRSIRGLRPDAIARRGVGRTFQVAATFASMTVRESVALALAARDGRDGAAAAPMLRLRSPRCDALLQGLGIAALANVHCGELAYGDAKRVELALALAGKPRVLLMDEPTAGLASASRSELMGHALARARRHGVAVLFTEHDMDVVFGFARRVIVLDRGAIIASGTPEAIRANPAVQAAYLGGAG